MGHWRVRILAMASCAALSVTAAAQERRTIWTGVYTAAQAERGKAAFETHCSGCHAREMDPANPESRLRGDGFIERWREYEANAPFIAIKSSMPRRAPGSLKDEMYLDILAHLLSESALPSGNSELSVPELENIRIQRREGPRPVPNGALIQLVGCLTRGDGDSWKLTSASEPIRTITSRNSTPKELEAAGIRTLGISEYRLQSMSFLVTTASFEPAAHEGHKVQTKGYLVRQPNRERIDLTSMEVLATSCNQ